VLVEAGAGIFFGQDAFEARVVALDGNHRIIHDLSDGGLFRAVLQVAPARRGRHPKDVLGFIFVLILGIRAGVVAFARDELGVVFLERVGDVFQEDEAEDDVLVFRRVHVIAELIGGEPELGLKAEIGGGVFGRGFRRGLAGAGLRHADEVPCPIQLVAQCRSRVGAGKAGNDVPKTVVIYELTRAMNREKLISGNQRASFQCIQHQDP